MKRAHLISWSAIADDPRVRRMGDSLHAAGWTVVGVGHAGARSAPPPWRVVEVSVPKPLDPAQERVVGRAMAACLAPVEGALRLAKSPSAAYFANARLRLRTLPRPLTSTAVAVALRIGRAAADLTEAPEERRLKRYWRLSPVTRGLKAAALGLESPALWIANDWWTLPAAAAGVAATGGVLVYDSHELATEEYAENPEWVRFRKPIVDAVEAHHIRSAALVSSVSPGITEHLRALYDLKVPTLTLRNTPAYQPIPFRPTGARVRVLYHGILSPGRGLEATIDSVALWRPELELALRGPSSPPDYVDGLRKRAMATGVANRVSFLDPVPMTELVTAAAPYDIGLMALPAHSLHNRHALPNKLFEYLMAGLALAVTDLPEMARLVGETKAGVLVADTSPEAIASALNPLTSARLDEMRRASLEAAKRLNWEAEAPPVLAAYDRLAATFAEPAAA